MRADLEAVKKQYILCKELIQCMGTTSNKIMNKYREAGTTWHDEHYVQLGRIIQECSESLLKTIMKISSTLNGLERAVAAIKEYEGINLSGGASSGAGGETSLSSSGSETSGTEAHGTEGGDTIAAVMRVGETWTNGLSSEELSALQYYTGTGYLNINPSLRGQTSFRDGDAERACAIHNALSNVCIPQPCTVYRGTTLAALGEYQNLSDRELVGCHIAEAGFMSTSLDPHRSFSGAVQLEISVPAGAHGAYVGYLSQCGHNESEVLFDAGQVLEITDVRRDFFGNRTICARIIT